MIILPFELENKEFDFLIGSQLLRATIETHLKENELETDKELEIQVVEKQSAPVPEHTYNGEDWSFNWPCVFSRLYTFFVLVLQ